MSKKKISVENEEFITYRALLLSIDFVKKLVTEMSDEDLNKVKENFDIAIQQRDERKENMKAIKSLMDEHGISLEDFYREFGKKLQAGRKSVSGGHKYRYEYNGKRMYWNGQGRRPKAIAEAIKAGGSLDDFLISQEVSSGPDYE
ncbi:TPA: H-NS family nucleoid-associated regulatory protein [Escherichia coli]|nr:H-NS histone family protein [Escherichia coli]HAN6771321.1 H-NS histone family protein [Escherichia coli]HCP7815517.1 H-NS histone family protein [Escherichia coli]HDD9734213.1 H-NS histone family protein [Escherichia coli]